jgi:hypothetical protein
LWGRGGSDTEKALTKARLLGDHIDLVATAIKVAHYQGTDIEYLSTTKNLDFIRIILFLGTYTWIFNPHMIERFNERNETLTGNEAVPDGTTALMFAVGGGYLELVRELLRRGANPFLGNRYGDNALSIAEIQLQRVQIVVNSELQTIYRQIQQELESAAKEHAVGVARVIRILQSNQLVKLPDGKVSTRPGLPYEVALRIVLADVNEREQRRILHYLEQLTEEEIAMPLTTPVTEQTFFERIRNYIPASGLAALYYYLSRGSNP